MSTRKACITCGQEFTDDEVVCPGDGTILTPLAKDPYLGTLLAGRYEILEIIGGGGMGLVYKARHTMMNRIVAIKMLHQHLTNSTDALKRFKLEAEAASCLSLPNILTIYDFGVSDEGQPYMVMDYLEGTSLADVLEAEGRLPVLRALNIFIQACAGLAHAHQKGVIHRDLKPSNIMLVNYADDQTDFVKIVDFGIAKLLNRADGNSANLTRTGEVYGSPLYMSPEQCRGQELDARSDLYAFGCVMYKTLTGLPVFTGSEMIELLFKQVSETPKKFADAVPDADLPSELEKVVFTALQKDADNRFQSMNELKDVLETFKRKVEGRDTTDTGDYPVTHIDVSQNVPAANPSAWAVQRPGGFGPGLVPGPLASALAHRAHEAGHHNQAGNASPQATGISGAAARSSTPTHENAQPQVTAPEAKAPPQPAKEKAAQPKPLPAPAPAAVPPETKDSAAGGNGSHPAATDANAWSATWTGNSNSSGQPPTVADLDSIPTPVPARRNTAETAKAQKQTDSGRLEQSQSGRLEQSAEKPSGKNKPDWLLMAEGIFANPMMIIAAIFVIILGVTVVAIYVSNHNKADMTPAGQATDTTIDTTTEDGGNPDKNKANTTTETSTSTATSTSTQSSTEPPVKKPTADTDTSTSTAPAATSTNTSTAPAGTSTSVSPAQSETNTPSTSPKTETPTHTAAPMHPAHTEKSSKAATKHVSAPAKQENGENEETKAHKHQMHTHKVTPTGPSHSGHRHAYSSYEF